MRKTIKITAGIQKERLMGTGIIMCGLNGAGKSTLGKALAEKLNFYFIDNEDLYFPKTDSGYMYASPRSRKEVEKLLFSEIKAHENFIFTSVKGDYGDAATPFFRYAVLVEVPRDLRIQRVKNRSFQKFGDRMLPGGDLYEKEERFFDLVESRAEDTVEEWAKLLSCPVIRVDGTKPVEENVKLIIERLQNEISGKYVVKKLGDDHIQEIFDLCRKNKLYYEYCPPMVTEESIKKDMLALPPNTRIEDKHYIGFYATGKLIAVMDLICGYPEPEMAYIGFFMVNTTIQNRGTGSEIISELCDYLKLKGFVSVRLAWVKGNPQAEHFWLKNRFVILKEATGNVSEPVILAERIL